jgi:hypothetical protein
MFPTIDGDLLLIESKKTDSLIRIERIESKLVISLASRDNEGTMRIESLLADDAVASFIGFGRPQ